MVEQDGLEVAFECRFHEAPHVLIAAEPVREHHSALAMTSGLNIVALDHIHSITPDPSQGSVTSGRSRYLGQLRKAARHVLRRLAHHLPSDS
jgi:hypothetical protein